MLLGLRIDKGFGDISRLPTKRITDKNGHSRMVHYNPDKDKDKKKVKVVSEEVQERARVNSKFNAELNQFLQGKLPKGHIFKLGKAGGILRKTGFPIGQEIELTAKRLKEKSEDVDHPFNPADIKNLVQAINEPVAIFSYGDKEKAQNIITKIQQKGNNYLVAVHFNQDYRGIEVSDVRNVFPKDTLKWLNWINQGKLLYANTKQLQAVVTQQQTNPAEVSNHTLEPIINLLEKNKGVKHYFPEKEPEKSLKTILKDVQKRNLEEEYGLEGGEFGIRVLSEGYDGYNENPGYHLAPSYNGAEDENGEPSGEELPGTSCISINYNGDLFNYGGDKVVLVRGYSAGLGNRGKIDPGEILLEDPVILEVLHEGELSSGQKKEEKKLKPGELLEEIERLNPTVKEAVNTFAEKFPEHDKDFWRDYLKRMGYEKKIKKSLHLFYGNERFLLGWGASPVRRI